MTALIWFTVGGLSLGPVFGLALHILLSSRVRARAFDLCQEQALITHGRRRIDEVNPDLVPRPRRRSPDVNEPFVARDMSSAPSVLGDQAR